MITNDEVVDILLEIGRQCRCCSKIMSFDVDFHYRKCESGIGCYFLPDEIYHLQHAVILYQCDCFIKECVL